ncbi:MAG: hypothetical protein J5I90_14340 [Caldilineales bacterium]|nr:hypothetical protein [Caldilineales bacterium]
MRQSIILVIAVLLVLAVAACAPAPAPVADAGAAQIEAPPVDAQAETPAAEPAAMSKPVPGGVVVRAITSEPSGLDPHGAPGSGQNILLPYLLDTLVYRDADNNYHPFLADSWEISDDGLTITFDLHPGVTFHDGTPMDADAVVYTFNRFMELGSASPVAGGLVGIMGVSALDDDTVQFEFEAPSSVFFGTISMPYAGIISPTAAEAEGEAFAQKPVGTGPFMLADWQPGVSLTLTRNPNYAWGPLDVENKGAPYIEQAVFNVIPDASTQLAAFQAGEADVIFLNQPAHLAVLEQLPDVDLTEAALNSLIYLGFNASRPPFDEALVRQALSHAINKEEILLAALGGIGKLACAPLASTLPGYDESLCDLELKYDPVQAEVLLAEAGFIRNDDGEWERNGEKLQAAIMSSTRPPNGDIAAVIQNQLAAIGVPVEIQLLEAGAAMEAAGAGNYDMMIWRYGWNDADVLNIYLGSDRIGSTNRQFYSNPEVDALFAQGMTELDPAARAQIYMDAQKLIMADAPWQPLYEPLDVIAVSGRVNDVVIGPMGRVLLNDAWVP